MKTQIEIEVPDSVLREMVVNSCVQHLKVKIDEVVRERVKQVTHVLENAVDVHLSKRLTNDDIKKMIDGAVTQRIREAIDDV